MWKRKVMTCWITEKERYRWIDLLLLVKCLDCVYHIWIDLNLMVHVLNLTLGGWAFSLATFLKLATCLCLCACTNEYWQTVREMWQNTGGLMSESGPSWFMLSKQELRHSSEEPPGSSSLKYWNRLCCTAHCLVI